MPQPIPRRVAKEELVRIDQALQEPHLLVGGLAVSQYHATRDSQDIDLVCSWDIARRLVDSLYPSNDWKFDEVQGDEYRPSFHIRHRLDDLGTIIFGPKIAEREPYTHIDWNALRHGAEPFRVGKLSLANILVPAAHALAYTKFISFLGRESSAEKIEADLEDFVNLTNHESFLLADFYDLMRKTNARLGLCAAFRVKCSNYPAILSKSSLNDLSFMFHPAHLSHPPLKEPDVFQGISKVPRPDHSTRAQVSKVAPCANVAGTWRVDAIVIDEEGERKLPPERANFSHDADQLLVEGEGCIVNSEGFPVLYKFTAEFISDTVLRYFLKPKSGEFDHVVGFLKLGPDATTMTGEALLLGVFNRDSTGPAKPMRLKLSKEQP